MTDEQKLTQVLLAPHAGPGVGGGHVMRCLTLADALAERGALCRFAVSHAGADLIARFAPGRFEVKALANPGELAVVVAGAHPQALILDDYRLDAAVESALKRQSGRLVVLDDLADRSHAADLVIDSGLGRKEDDYRRLAPKAIVLAGPRYALVRPEFAAHRRDPGARAGSALDRIFVSFGLSDVDEIAERAVMLLLSLAPSARLEVVIAADAPSLKGLARLAARDIRVRLHVDARDFAGLIATCDLAVGAGGSALWERAAVGIANLVVVVADNQRAMAAQLQAAGLACTVDLHAPQFEERFAEQLTALRDAGLRATLADALADVCDGEGAGRAADEILWLARR